MLIYVVHIFMAIGQAIWGAPACCEVVVVSYACFSMRGKIYLKRCAGPCPNRNGPNRSYQCIVVIDTTLRVLMVPLIIL